MISLGKLAKAKKKSDAKDAREKEKGLVKSLRDAAAFVGVTGAVSDGALVEALARMVADPEAFKAAGDQRIADVAARLATPSNNRTASNASAAPVEPPSTEARLSATLPARTVPHLSEGGRRAPAPGRSFRLPDPLSNG